MLSRGAIWTSGNEAPWSKINGRASSKVSNYKLLFGDFFNIIFTAGWTGSATKEIYTLINDNKNGVEWMTG